MRSSWGIRLVSVVMAVAAAFVVTGEAAGIHRCPVHDMLPSGGASSHGAPVSAEAHAAGDHDASAPENDAAHGCHCLGPCCAARALALPVVAAAFADFTYESVRHHVVAVVSHEPVAAPHTLPFSVGPPAAI